MPHDAGETKLTQQLVSPRTPAGEEPALRSAEPVSYSQGQCGQIHQSINIKDDLLT